MTCQDLYHSFPLLFCYSEGIPFLLPKANFTTCALNPTGPDFLGTLVYPLFLLFCIFKLSLSPDSSLSALKLSAHLYYLKKKKKKPALSLTIPRLSPSLRARLPEPVVLNSPPPLSHAHSLTPGNVHPITTIPSTKRCVSKIH